MEIDQGGVLPGDDEDDKRNDDYESVVRCPENYFGTALRRCIYDPSKFVCCALYSTDPCVV